MLGDAAAVAAEHEGGMGLVDVGGCLVVRAYLHYLGQPGQVPIHGVDPLEGHQHALALALLQHLFQGGGIVVGEEQHLRPGEGAAVDQALVALFVKDEYVTLAQQPLDGTDIAPQTA